MFEAHANECALKWTLKRNLSHYGFMRLMAAERGGFFDEEYGRTLRG